jgi:hypothetical protein
MILNQFQPLPIPTTYIPKKHRIANFPPPSYFLRGSFPRGLPSKFSMYSLSPTHCYMIADINFPYFNVLMTLRYPNKSRSSSLYNTLNFWRKENIQWLELNFTKLKTESFWLFYIINDNSWWLRFRKAQWALCGSKAAVLSSLPSLLHLMSYSRKMKERGWTTEMLPPPYPL